MIFKIGAFRPAQNPSEPGVLVWVANVMAQVWGVVTPEQARAVAADLLAAADDAERQVQAAERQGVQS